MKRYSNISRLVSCMFLFFSQASFAQETTATVLSVIGGDALKIRDDKGERLVALYGIHFPPLISTQPEKNAKNFISDKVLGHTINVETITQKAGLSYVEITLPDGSILNHLMIEQGLAEVDKLTASKDVLYSQLEQESRDEGRGLWYRNDLPSNEALKSASTPRTEPAKTFEEFERGKYIVSVAQFETEYVKWKSLSKNQRSQYVAYLEGNREQNRIRHEPLINSRSRTAGATQVRLNANSGRISEQQKQFAAVPSVKNVGPGLAWVTNPPKNLPSTMTAGEMNRWDAAWQSQRSGIGRALGYLANERNALQAYNQRAQRSLGTAVTISDNQEARSNRKLARIALLERAIQDDYSPYFETSLLESWTDQELPGSLTFTTESKLWRVEWTVQKKGAERFSATLHSSSESSLVGALVDNRPPHESFLIFDQPGTYTLKVRADTGVRWKLAVVEFEDSLD